MPLAIDRLQRSNVHSYQRPDATHLTYDPTSERLAGHAGSVNVNKISGQRTRFTFGVSYKTPGFDVNDLGFMSRADDISTIGWYQVRDDVPGKYIKTFRFNLNQWGSWNFGGDRRSFGGNVNAHWSFMNNWAVGSGFNVNAQGFADRLTRGGPGGYTPGNFNQWMYLDTDNRKPVVLNLFASWFNDHGASAGLERRSRSHLAAEPRAERDRRRQRRPQSRRRAVDREPRRRRPDALRLRPPEPDHGQRLDARQLHDHADADAAALRAAVRVGRRLRRASRSWPTGALPSYADRYSPYDYTGEPDFNYRSFRTTNVLRWEYRPGSVLFVVWQQGREVVAPLGDFQFGRDFSGLFDAPATSVFLVKISRWFNF